MGHDPEKVAQAMTLLGNAYSSLTVSEMTGIPASTIRDWSRSSEIVSKYGDAIKAGRERLAYRTSQLADRIMDKVESGELDVSPVQAFTMWGIATDKVQKDSQGNPQVAILTIINNYRDSLTAQEPSTIDGVLSEPSS